MKKSSLPNYKQDLLKSNSTWETFHKLCDLLDKQKKVYYSRFGDGDVVILMGRAQANHQYSDRLAEEMGQSLLIEDPLFLRGTPINYPNEKGMTKGLFERYYYNDHMVDFLLENFKLSRPVVFESSWFPNYFTAFYPREMNRFLDRYIRPKRKMFIGSIDQSEVEKVVGKIDIYIQIPRKNAFARIDEWWPEILKNLDSVELVLPAAGMASRVISKRLWVLNKELHCIDLGSLVDAASSLPPSRKWIKLKRHTVNRIILPEFRDNSLSSWIKYGIKETALFFRYHYYRIDPLANSSAFPKAQNWKPGPKKFKKTNTV